MKVLLIYPPEKNIVYKVAPAVFSEEAGAYPPLGLVYLATSIRKEGKHEVEILDTVVNRMEYADIGEYVRSVKPDVVGITFFTFYLRDALAAMKEVRKAHPPAKIIIGGPHVDVFPGESVKFDEVDAAVYGDGDIVINTVLDNIAAGRPLDDIPGVITRANRDRQHVKQLVDDLDSLPLPDRTFLPYNRYESVLAAGKPIATIITSRGCPFNCPYCSGGGVKPRNISPARVAAELEECSRLGIKDFILFDELFTLKKKRVFEICDEINRRGLRIRWNVRARIGTVDREMIQRMKSAGCRLIQYGIETGSPRMQKVIGRKHDLGEIEEMIRITREEGILTYGDFMFGLPGETPEEMKKTVDFAVKIKLDYAVFGILSVYPRTEYYRQVLEEGRIEEDFWQKFAEDPSYEVKTTFWPGEHDPKELEKTVVRAYIRFYFRFRNVIRTLFRKASIMQKLLLARSAFKVFAKVLK